MKEKREAILCGNTLAMRGFCFGRVGTRPKSTNKRAEGTCQWLCPGRDYGCKSCGGVLIPVYGEKRIEAERPFHATMEGDVWNVEGTLYCPDGTASTPSHMCKGGTAVVKLSKTDARILFMMHYK